MGGFKNVHDMQYSIRENIRETVGWLSCLSGDMEQLGHGFCPLFRLVVPPSKSHTATLP